MQHVFLVLDHVLHRDGERPTTVLTAELGVNSVLGYVGAEVAAAGGRSMLVSADFAPDDTYRAAINAASNGEAEVVRHEHLPSRWKDLEPSDWVVIVDARYWPTSGHELPQLLSHADGFLGVTYGVAIGSNLDRTKERVEYDEAGRLRCIRRFYDRVTRPVSTAIAVPQALVPVWAITGLSFSSIAELRGLLINNGVLSRDWQMATDVADLATERALLTLSEQLVISETAGELPRAYSELSDGVLIGRGCLVHSSTRIVPPVIIHPGVIVEEKATIIGPTVVGAASTIGRSAVVAHSLLARGTRVAAGDFVRHRLAFGDWSRSPDHDKSAEPGDTDVGALTAEWSDGSFVAANIEDATRKRRAFHMVKRAIDVLFTSVGLLVLAIPMAIVAALIRLTSEGPIFFAHEREGRDGVPFNCLKFRTMYRDAHARQREMYSQNLASGPHFKMTHDPRVTPLGRVLRKTNVDELPQLINVLRGQMSLVGPRPSPFRENQLCVSWRRARLSVRPGITGLWQICRGDLTQEGFQGWVFYDLLYVRNMSWWLDTKILIATVLSMGGRRRVPVRWLIRHA